MSSSGHAVQPSSHKLTSTGRVSVGLTAGAFTCFKTLRAFATIEFLRLAAVLHIDPVFSPLGAGLNDRELSLFVQIQINPIVTLTAYIQSGFASGQVPRQEADNGDRNKKPKERKMRKRISRIIVAGVFAATVSLQADAGTHSKSIIVEPPSDLPQTARGNSEAMYLHYNGDGQAILYLEQEQGRALTILDVSDPARIRAAAQVSIAAPAPYDFVQPLSDSAVLIHFRDKSGFAIIDFKKWKRPVLTEAPQFQQTGHLERCGHSCLLLTSASPPSTQNEDPQYEVFDISNPSQPAALATVSGVQQRLERPETGTLFLLSKTGLTVVRRPHMEEEYEILLNQQRAN